MIMSAGPSGGRHRLPPRNSTFRRKNILIGNVALYGATGEKRSSTAWPAALRCNSGRAPWWKAWATMGQYMTRARGGAGYAAAISPPA
jgi:hypothetical protein